ncbi:hypothetical protein CCR75_002384 [Bremia lactucae]|uniref:Guanylate-binding protein N-terminal domain-containing protein n=1 Tax=Bremia lactucae TaxID=4779 RepID=A0A976FND4_BRELC|nr:hypothetical protein CCR75_002384 [Bremia lactucae]
MQEVVTYVVEVARQRNMQIRFVNSIPVDFKKESLKTAAQWPESELEGVSAMLERSLQTLKVQSKEQAQALIEDFCATMFSHQDRFFSLDFLIEEHNKEPAFVALRKVLDDLPLNRNIWSKLDCATQMTLLLPSRLRRQLKAIASHFHDNLETCSEEEVASSLAKYMRDFTVSDKKLVDSSDGIISYFWNIITGPKTYSGDLLSDNFRKCMEMPLQEAYKAWSHSVAKYINVAESALPAALTEEMQKSLVLSCEADKTKLISDAFSKLRSTWREQHIEDLTTTIRLLLVTILRERTVLECIDFSIKLSARSSSIGKVLFNREIPLNSWLCDFDALERVVAFAEESGRVVLYRFNKQFTTLEIYKQVKLSLRTALALPAAELLLVDGFIYATDANGMIQSVNVNNQQSSRAVNIQPLGLRNSSLFALADNMALGFVRTLEVLDTTEGTQFTKLYAVASDDFRNIPVIHVEDLAPPFNNLEKTRDVIVYRLVVTVKRESFRIQHPKEHSVNGNTTSDLAEGGEADHWLREFYHLYEKFPVRGLIQDVDDSRVPLRLHFIACAAMTDAVKNSGRNYFQILMRDLRKLNKPLFGMDLTQDMVFETEVVMSKVAVRPLRRFLLKLVTFVPIQICRAEANSLTILTNGEATSMDSRGHLVQAVQIARSIRFGLLSPLLESWPGRCVAITCMGKQSTGKSYLLNHLTGSSFAIAGARCTDGAWMSAQILPKNNVLLVTLYFEGLMSVERTEQEDIFLSVLNASISMLTIFRMEMRFDKDIEDLFGRFQKGVRLFKGDPRLFRGKLYMSVKDVNSNAQQGVMNEFATNILKLISLNKDSNFLVDHYCGQLDINCSPPLGTIGYYQSLRHAQNYIENSLCAGNEGFQNGKKFLDCIRLVLAKIAILDWTSLDASAKQFQLSEIISQLPGLIRTGCILPFDYKAREEEIEQYLKENMLQAHSEKVINVDLATLSREYPTLSAKWEQLNLLVDLDSCLDWNIDVGFDCCSTEDNIIMKVHESIKQLYQLFLTSARIKEGKVLGVTVADFDIFLSFFVRRRKARISMYVKQILGGIVPDEWKRSRTAISRAIPDSFVTLSK